MILELLQLVDFCRTSTAPDRATVSKVGLNNTCAESFQTCHRQKGFSMSQKADRPGDFGRSFSPCLSIIEYQQVILYRTLAFEQLRSAVQKYSHGEVQQITYKGSIPVQLSLFSYLTAWASCGRFNIAAKSFLLSKVPLGADSSSDQNSSLDRKKERDQERRAKPCSRILLNFML